MSFKSWLNENTTFLTNKGSSYEFADGRSRRTKSLHALHDKDDVGTKEISDATVFIHAEFAREVGMWGTSNGKRKRIVLVDGKVYLLTWNDIADKHGLDKIHSNNAFVLNPIIGYCPLELWQSDVTHWPWFKPGMKVFKSSHPGNQIVKIN